MFLCIIHILIFKLPRGLKYWHTNVYDAKDCNLKFKYAESYVSQVPLATILDFIMLLLSTYFGLYLSLWTTWRDKNGDITHDNDAKDYNKSLNC